jgi:ABC-type glycerol-3-phosphate transport system substrate-binding protein
MLKFTQSMPAIIAALLLSALLLSACGDGDEDGDAQTATPTEEPVATATATPTSTEEPTPDSDGTITLSITSVSPDPAAPGDEVAIVFETAPGAEIGLQVTDSEGNTVAQTQLTAGPDGIATYHHIVDVPAGAWLVEAAAGATVQDLLALQLNPVAGPHSDEASFEVQ